MPTLNVGMWAYRAIARNTLAITTTSPRLSHPRGTEPLAPDSLPAPLAAGIHSRKANRWRGL